MPRLAVFADVPNLYHATIRKFDNTLDYEEVWAFLQKKGEITKAVAYGTQRFNEDGKGEAERFIKALQHIGFETKWRSTDEYEVKGHMGVEIAMDVMRCYERMDMIWLLTGDANLVPLVQYLREKGVKCFILGCRISREMRMVATEWKEVGRHLLNLYEDD